MMDVSMTLDNFDMLIQFASDNLERLRGTVYEQYSENVLKVLLAEREEYIAYMARTN